MLQRSGLSQRAATCGGRLEARKCLVHEGWKRNSGLRNLEKSETDLLHRRFTRKEIKNS